MQVELVYEKTCPNIRSARTQLLKAFVDAGITPHWQEWEISSTDAPEHVHGYGSPTILIDGHDVCGERPDTDDFCCRIYAHHDGENKGVPALADIVRVLKSYRQVPEPGQTASRVRLNSTMLPTLGIAFLPKLACPACWPAYAGLLSAAGISFIDYTPYLLPLTLVFLFIAITALAYQADRRHGYRPLLLGLFSAGLLIVSKFNFDSDAAMYTGLVLLVTASLWNTWPESHNTSNACPSCDTSSQDYNKLSNDNGRQS